ncbi:MAG: homoserine O-succinyltransferase [Chitinivibrionales bacterium]|nr:homoserine O-succinyltransferase [Chitinivibrionales bacterium]MBD3357828.1 homoserine O-succinyltransferase [Chitinivibrionales bacterium]
MTIVLPKDYHARRELESRRILCISQQQALQEDIRALRIGILNIMPMADTYEFSLLFPLGRSVIQIEPVWLRLKTHAYKSTDQDHLESLYVSFDEAIAGGGLDGLILTGAPVEEMPFEKVTYWSEVKEILAYARTNISSTLGICWGGLALAKFIGIDKIAFARKLFGIFETRNIHRTHRVTGEMDDVFWCPQSRYSGIPDNVLENEQRKGNVTLLAHSEEAGYVIFESADKRFMMHLGHHEYEADRLVEEYQRDKAKGRTDVDPPVNLDPANPVNRWRGQSLEFFAQWIRYIHEEGQGRL